MYSIPPFNFFVLNIFYHVNVTINIQTNKYILYKVRDQKGSNIEGPGGGGGGGRVKLNCNCLKCPQ